MSVATGASEPRSLAGAVSLQRYSGGSGLMRAAGAAGLLGLVGCVAGFVIAPKQAYFSYLFAFCYWVGIAVAGIILLAIFHATKAKWMVVLRRAVETVAVTPPIFALLFIPIALGMRQLYIWVDPPPTLPEHTLHLLHHKHPYLNVPFFLARAAFYFASWSLIGYLLHRWSVRQDESGAVNLTVKQRRLGVGALPVLALTLTFAAFDWMMSLDPTWVSTIFGVYFFAGAFVSVIAIIILAAAYGQGENSFGRWMTPAHFHNLGKLLLGFTAFWAYIAFSQFLLIWIANIPEETPWYLVRTRQGWKPVAYFLAVGHFVIPFFILLSQRLKTRPRALARVAAWILLMHAVDVYWLILPILYPHAPAPNPLDLAAWLGVGGVAVAFAIWRHRGRYAVPVRDPYLENSLRYTQP
ncbi:MAG TPA: hypothetical protein VEY30_11845 [Myxococcaceae bacterium]|nr:hypothetical protein [Myxococcaceae bacterium]